MDLLQIYLPVAGNSVSLLLLLGLGGLVGLLSGLFGVGGGFLLTPLLIMIGIPPTVAAASDSNQIVAAASSGSFAHSRSGNVDYKMGVLLLLGGLVGGTAGVQLIKILRATGQAGFAIRLTYVVMLAGIGTYMFFDSLRALRLARAGVVPGASRGGGAAALPLRPGGPGPALQDDLRALGGADLGADAPGAGRPGRGAGRHHGGGRRLHHGAGDGVPAAHAHARRGRHEPLPDPLHVRQRHRAPGVLQPHRRLPARPDPAGGVHARAPRSAPASARGSRRTSSRS